MATKKQTQNQATEQTTAQVSSKMRAYREHLKVITKGLVEMATELGYLNTHFVRFVIQTIQSTKLHLNSL